MAHLVGAVFAAERVEHFCASEAARARAAAQAASDVAAVQAAAEDERARLVERADAATTKFHDGRVPKVPSAKIWSRWSVTFSGVCGAMQFHVSARRNPTMSNTGG